MPTVDNNAPYVTMTLPPTVSQEEREELRRLHVSLFPGGNCRICTRHMASGTVHPAPLPCLPLRTLDALEAAERERDAAHRRDDVLVVAHYAFYESEAEENSTEYRTLWDEYETALSAVFAAHDARTKGQLDAER